MSELDDRITDLRSQMEKLERQLSVLEDQKRLENADYFLSRHEVTLDKIEMSGGGKPYFTDIWEFIDWLRDKHLKPFVEWNGVIHLTSDLLYGKFVPSGATVDDVKERMREPIQKGD